MNYLRCYISAAPGASKSWTFTLRVNSATPADALTCTISGASETTCTDLTGLTSLAVGDRVSIQATPSGTPAAANGYCTLISVAGSSRQENIFGNTNDTTTLGTTEYIGIQGAEASWNSTNNNVYQVASTGGTLGTFYVNLNTAPGGSASTVFTLFVNGSAPANGPTCTVSTSGTTCNDTTHTATIVAGDKLSLQYIPTSSPAATVTHWSFLFTPTIDGESLYLVGSSGTGAASSTTVNSYGNIWDRPQFNTTETITQNPVQGNITIKNLYVALDTAPDTGAGIQSYVYTVRKNGAATNITCTISEANKTCSDLTHTVNFVDGGLVGLESAPSGTPAASNNTHYGVTELLKRKVY